MTNDDFKDMLDEAIRPLKDSQDEFRKELTGVKEEVNGIKEDQKDLRKLIEERVLPPLVYIETTVKGYADMYKINDSNIRRMEKRLETVEDNDGIDVPPELKLEPLPEPPAQP